MDELDEIKKIENDEEKIKAIYNYACELLKNIVIAADEKDKEKLDSFKNELHELLTLVVYLETNNTNALLNGKYIHLNNGISNLISATSVIKKTMNMDLLDMRFSTFDTWYIIYHRTFLKKYDGPLFFASDFENKSFVDIGKMIKEELSDVNNVDDYVAKIIDISFNQITKELPDYYDMYQMTKNIKANDVISTTDIAEILNNCNDLSHEDIEIINNYFLCFIGNKTYKIIIDRYPLEVIIACSDGRELKANLAIKREMVPEFDMSGEYERFTTSINLYFPTHYGITLECTASRSYDDDCNKDALQAIVNLNNPVTPGYRKVDWRYLVLHKDDYISKEELKIINEEFNTFVKGLTNENPSERIFSLVKVLGTKEKNDLIQKLKETK